MLLGFASPLFSEEVSVRFSDGTRATGTLQGHEAAELRFVAQGVDRPLEDIRRIAFPPGAAVMRNTSPARLFYLQGGEAIAAELRRLTDDQIALLWRGNDITLPRHAVLAIDQPLSERQVLFDDFDAADLAPVWKANGDVALAHIEKRAALRLGENAFVSHSLEKPLRKGRVSAAFFNPSSEKKSIAVGLELNFLAEKTTTRVTIPLASTEEFHNVIHSPNFRLTKQPLRRNPGWHQVTVLFDEARFQVLIDSHLLAYGNPIDVPLKSIRIVSESAHEPPADPSPDGWIDAVQLSEFVSEEPPQSFSLEKQAQVLMETGETLYGEILSSDSQEVRIQTAFGELALAWNRVRRVILAEDNRGEPMAFDATSSPLGWQADVTFQRYADHPNQPAERLFATILAADDQSLRLAHRWLGTHRIASDQLDEIEPRFYGQSRVLAFASAHLGNQVQSAFLHKEPLGTTWHGKFALHAIPRGVVFLCIKASELEPSGPDTPPGSPHLSELRNGGLATELVLNEKLLGRLNDLVSQKANRDAPEEIRLAVPLGVLRRGENTWSLRQTPQRGHSQEFDDCELGPIVLEFQQAPRD